LVRIYLDELPPASPEQIELGILELIAAQPETALAKARALVPRVRTSKRPRPVQRLLLQFIETVIVFQFPNWTRAEIEKMLQVTEVSQTRVYQEALEEGRKEGIEKGVEVVARRLLTMGRPIAEIVQATGLTAARIRKLSKSDATKGTEQPK
jgi:predicted transposase/invertase (TIGR01784 family)